MLALLALALDGAPASFTAPAWGTGIAIGRQSGPLAPAGSGDLLTLTARRPWGDRALYAQVDPAQLVQGLLLTCRATLGLSAWASAPQPIARRWAGAPGLGVDLDLGREAVVEDGQLAHDPVIGLAAQGRLDLIHAGDHDGAQVFGLRAAGGYTIPDGPQWRVEGEVLFLRGRR